MKFGQLLIITSLGLITANGAKNNYCQDHGIPKKHNFASQVLFGGRLIWHHLARLNSFTPFGGSGEVRSLKFSHSYAHTWASWHFKGWCHVPGSDFQTGLEKKKRFWVKIQTRTFSWAIISSAGNYSAQNFGGNRNFETFRDPANWSFWMRELGVIKMA